VARRRGDDGLAVEVAGGQAHRFVGLGDEGCVGVGVDVHGHAADAHLPGGADDAAGDLAPVGDEQR
jgi:hypothetical protein